MLIKVLCFRLVLLRSPKQGPTVSLASRATEPGRPLKLGQSSSKLQNVFSGKNFFLAAEKTDFFPTMAEQQQMQITDRKNGIKIGGTKKCGN